MKLKKLLILAFFTLTTIPISVVLLLLYKSGCDLSKASYIRNLSESINVQADYISQTIENNMIMDSRFVNRNLVENPILADTESEEKMQLLSAIKSYLEVSEDKITVCILLDENNEQLYTIGEKAMLDKIEQQLPDLSKLRDQRVMEFEMASGGYSLGVVTPVWQAEEYKGSMVSIYNESYVFKIISSYYKIADTSFYICRENGDVISFRGAADESQADEVREVLASQTFAEDGNIDSGTGGMAAFGYYKNIHNAPWYLVGFVDDAVIFTFANQFIWAYIVFIVIVMIADILLSLYFSKKVVGPINNLIRIIEGYQNNLDINELQYKEKEGYYETRYLYEKFSLLMRTISLVQHNFKGIYQLYQSGAMDDTNIDIDVKAQTIHSNKEVFQTLMNSLEILEGDCIVDKFIKCFCEKDQAMLLAMFEGMRDEHLSVTQEAEVYTPHLNQKWFHILVVPMYEDERLARLFVQLRDISGFKKQEFESLEQARKDSLTGLYNRAGFAECVNKVLRAAGDSDTHALLFIDMNYFKLVNDNLGHSTGDTLLRTVAETLLKTARPIDIVSRFGGDEFAVFMPYATMESAESMKTEMTKQLVYPYATEKISFVVSVSIGVSTWKNTSPDTLDRMLEQADAAMYHAKREFKKSVEG